MFKLYLGREITFEDDITVEKYFGQWSENATELDDMAYYLCVYSYTGGSKTFSSYSFIDQSIFIENQKKFEVFAFYYNIARKVLRKQKLKKLCSKSEIK